MLRNEFWVGVKAWAGLVHFDYLIEATNRNGITANTRFGFMGSDETSVAGVVWCEESCVVSRLLNGSKMSVSLVIPDMFNVRGLVHHQRIFMPPPRLE